MMVAPMALVTMLLEAIIAMTSLVTLLTKMVAMLLGMTSFIKSHREKCGRLSHYLMDFQRV